MKSFTFTCDGCSAKSEGVKPEDWYSAVIRRFKEPDTRVNPDDPPSVSNRPKLKPQVNHYCAECAKEVLKV